MEPVVASEHYGSSAGLSVFERAEAELDRRERALGLLLASADGANGSNHTTYIRTYSDIVKCNTYIDPIHCAGVTNATEDLAKAGVPAQIQMASSGGTPC